ncbi:MAG: transposase [Candidatus Micrarchaeaceae archaeon]
MPYDPQRHHRRSIRLPGYDYTQPGAYFVTLVTQDRECLFGEIVDGEMHLNDAGHVAERCWRDIPAHFPHITLDVFVIMPNHVHGILWIVGDDMAGAKNFSPHPRTRGENAGDDPGDDMAVGAKNFSPLPPPPPTPSLPPRGTSKTIGSVVRGFKIGVTKWFRQNTSIYTVWQRNYYEHIIRDEEDLRRIRQYIRDNPARWAMDHENPANAR